MRFVVIGGDAAGMSAASRARRLYPDLEITVLEQGHDVSYSACSMPYNIADPDTPMDDLVVRTAEEFIEKHHIHLLTGHEITAIHPDKKQVTGRTLQGDPVVFAYDKLLIATGAVPTLPDLPGKDRLMPLKQLEHGRRIKDVIRKNKVKNAVILGMGYIALEMCEALTELGIHVTMVKPGPRLLPWLPEKIAQIIQTHLIEKQITLHMGTHIQRIEPAGTGSTIVCDTMNLDADLAIGATGVAPCSGLAKNAGLTLGVSNAIQVDPYLRTSNPDIFAAGDCGDAIHVVTGKPVWIPLALRANRAGWAVADNLFKDSNALQGVAGTAVFKVFDLAVARTGLTFFEAKNAGFDPVENQITSLSRARWQPGAAKIHVNMVGDRRSGRLLGAQITGTDGVAHRINAVAVALHATMSVADFIQTDLAYAPPFSPTWDPMLTAAIQLGKKL
ncbi:FAD-dependent oxidoreductase [Desulfotignum phosphitoxidans]|uniref:Coenzyme A disulfide reductase n=1 Tax=Desulfotignum phosphitoxidans DSM 13687 TaxID=1286635 RepID=S0FV11_9BACT|nr:FAD-dependent oxidoreductase [Desulfotignum phosphitoxidans]EMS78938.1 coenzyme A disulfide reductase [Desulfotignum phosphitoxidans DSM 13687]